MPAKVSLLNIARTDRSTDKNELNCYRLKLTQYSRYNVDNLADYLKTNTKKGKSQENPQWLFATQPYCIRTRQGQHYRRDVACLEQEFNCAPMVWFNSEGDSLVAVKTILPIQIVKYKKIL